MQIEFDITDIVLMKYFLGIQIKKSTTGIFFYQQKHAINIVHTLKMINYKPVGTPISLSTKLRKQDEGPSSDSTLYKSLVGSVLYLIIIRMDIMFL